jgi:hypothetical protein
VINGLRSVEPKEHHYHSNSHPLKDDAIYNKYKTQLKKLISNKKYNKTK